MQICVKSDHEKIRRKPGKGPRFFQKEILFQECSLPIRNLCRHTVSGWREKRGSPLTGRLDAKRQGRTEFQGNRCFLLGSAILPESAPVFEVLARLPKFQVRETGLLFGTLDKKWRDLRLYFRPFFGYLELVFIVIHFCRQRKINFENSKNIFSWNSACLLFLPFSLFCPSSSA